MIPSAAQVIAIATGEIGYNGGPGPTSKYGEWYGINPGNWCAMFISWCGDQAARKINGTNPYAGLETSKGFAYTPNGFNGFVVRGQSFTDPKQVRPGDIVFYDYGMGRISHVGIVSRVNPTSYETVEGNTYSGTGGRDGNTCAAHTHQMNDSHWRGGGHPSYGAAVAGDGTAPTPSTEGRIVPDSSALSGLSLTGKIALAGGAAIFLIIGAIMVFTSINS